MLTMKQMVARALAGRVKNGEVVGIGSGSTVELALELLAPRIAEEGLEVFGIPTSHRTALVAEEAGVRVMSAVSNVKMTWAFDGADEVDADLNMIKGRGAAMLSEKIIAKRAEHLVIIVSAEKIVDSLGSTHPVPVEVIPEAAGVVEEHLKELGASKVALRMASAKYGPIITEHSNMVLDAKFSDIPLELEDQIKQITGVVESGLFIGMADEVLVAKEDGVWSMSIADGKIRQELL